MTMHSKKFLFVSIFFLIAPLISFAGWQVAKPDATVPREPFFQRGRTPEKVSYKGAYTTPHVVPIQHISTVPGKAVYIPVAYKKNIVPRPVQHVSLAQPVYAVSISGSIKENLERIMGRYRWRVVWKAPYDYNFDGRVTGSSLPAVVNKLLQPFPLQAVMYMSNRTLAVVPRTKI